MNTSPDYPGLDDGRLVQLHLAGDWRAFRQIVERHQATVCALTLSACGDLARSEDLAQEVFIAAWKQLPRLREPEKLRGWLCGIARNLAHNALRRRHLTPTTGAAELSADTPAETDDPRDRAATAEEAALLWRALATLPETYREPMVLFYREHRSAAAVGAALELSEELVRQRLVRGRAMLTERMAKLVEETLARSAPQPSAFAGAVLLGLPLGIAPSLVLAEAGLLGGASTKLTATAGAIGTAAKGGLALKLLAATAALPALLGGLTDYLRFRAHLESAPAAGRGDVVRRHVLPLLGNMAALAVIALLIFGGSFANHHPFGFGLGVALLVGGAAALTARYHRQLAGRTMPAARGFEYRSRGGWLGLPWIHVRAGGEAAARGARGWIAISDRVAVGGLFAGGPVAIAPLGVGNVALGLLSLGGLVVGGGALGGMAAGWWAAGGLAVGGEAAWGGIAVARDFAAGGLVFAAQAGDAAAHAFFASHPFFQFVAGAWRVALWASFLAWLPALLLIGWHLRCARPARA